MKKTICLVFGFVFLLCCQDEKTAKAEISFNRNELSEIQISQSNDTPEQYKNVENSEGEFSDSLAPEVAVIIESYNALVLLYQKEIGEWLEHNRIKIQTKDEILYKTITLFTSPRIIENFPPVKPVDKIETYDCFALGKFLNMDESEWLFPDAYSVVPDADKNRYKPLNTIENFKKALVFNVSDLFNNPVNEGINSDYSGEYAYLFFLFKTEEIEPVFDTQYHQIKSSQQLPFLITPYSYYYALFRIDYEGIIEFVICYGIN
jgi:hypothetical protein